MDWYTLRVISGKEKKIKEAILNEVSNASLGEQIKDILVPTENIVEMRDGKKKVKEKVFFPGYMLVNIEMNKNTRFLLENVNGVISFVGPKGNPQPLKPEEAQRFLGEYDGEGGHSEYHKGQEVLQEAQSQKETQERGCSQAKGEGFPQGDTCCTERRGIFFTIKT